VKGVTRLTGLLPPFIILLIATKLGSLLLSDPIIASLA